MQICRKQNYQMIKRVLDFVNDGIWRVPLENKSKPTRFLFRQLRILIFSVKEYNEDNLMLRASALTYYSLLSIVPVIAMLFGIAKGFQLDKELKTKIMEQANNNVDVWKKVIDFSEGMLQNTEGGIVAGFGIVLLLWSVMKLFGNIEASFNDIWQIRHGRSWIRKFTDYFSLMLITPILFTLSSSATIFVKSQFEELAESFALLGFFGPVVNFLFRLVPYVLIWAVFSILYMIMPNTKVKIGSAIIAGIIAGTGFQLFEWVYITFQVGVTRYNAIYGSFAALPLFLIWLQTSWLIVLVSAEIAFANQNIERYENEQQSHDLNAASMKLISIYILRSILETYKTGGDPKTAGEIAEEANIPIRMTQKAIDTLCVAKLLVETRIESAAGEYAYVPLKEVSEYRVSEIYTALDSNGAHLELERLPQLNALSSQLNTFNNAIQTIPENHKLIAIQLK